MESWNERIKKLSIFSFPLCTSERRKSCYGGGGARSDRKSVEGFRVGRAGSPRRQCSNQIEETLWFSNATSGSMWCSDVWFAADLQNCQVERALTLAKMSA